jgi:hypothetical protein
VTLYAGGNDPMRPKVDIDALAEAYDEAVGRLRASGARVVLFTSRQPIAARSHRSAGWSLDDRQDRH